MAIPVRQNYRNIARWTFLGCLVASAYGAVDKDITLCPVLKAKPPAVPPLDGVPATKSSFNSTNNFSSAIQTEPNAIISDACVSYSTVEKLNAELHPLVKDLTQHTDFFGYYRLDLYGRECPFWSDDTGFCGNRACAVDVTEEKDIPVVWRASELGKLAGPKASQPETKVEREEPSPLGGALGPDTSESCVFEPNDIDKRDYCVPEDESESNSVYVSLLDNPERFTGYAGQSANNVWRAVYQENCFTNEAQAQSSPFGGFGSSFPNAGAASDLKNVLDRKKHEIVSDSLTSPQTDEQCLEKRVFYRVISGMHASISMHLCDEYLNQTTGEWGPNLQCYKDRLHSHPERIQNIYFNYALLLRAVAKLRNNLKHYTFCSGDPYEDKLTKGKIITLADRIAKQPKIFDESLMFHGEDAITLKEDFRNRFMNVSRLMDCVGCDKCRLWGKIQTSGYGTAMKILFEFDEHAENGSNPTLRRTELVALVNTLGRLSNSLSAAGNFARMVERERRLAAVAAEEAAREEEEEEEETHVPEYSLSAMFWSEFGDVVIAFKHVMRSWYELPLKVWRIYKWANAVLLDKFLGRDVHITRLFPYRHARDEL